MIRRLLIGLCCLSAVGAAGVAATWQGLLARIEARHPGLPAGGVFVDVRPGDSTRTIAERLEAAGVVREAWTFRFAAWRGGHERALQAGEYYFDEPASPVAVLAKIAAGRVHLKPITFPEGLTLPQMGAVVDAWGLASAAEFAAASRRVELVADLDPAAADLEGYLFPETYSLPRTATVDDLVAAMVARFRVVFDAELRARAAERGLTTREAVTLASIIQRESGSEAEFPLVSAVFNNRLRIGMPLQSDPTTIYALERAGRYDGNLTPRQPALRFALQHLRLPGPAPRPDRRSRGRGPPRGPRPRRRQLPLLRQPQRRHARLRRHAARAQPQRPRVPGGVLSPPPRRALTPPRRSPGLHPRVPAFPRRRARSSPHQGRRGAR